MSTTLKTRSAAVREKLSHPIIDGDGHFVEYMPVVLEFMREAGGSKFVERFAKTLPSGARNHDGGPERVGGPAGWYGLTRQQRKDLRVTRASFWQYPTGSSFDRATVMLPNLYRQRMDELGIDYAIIYTSLGLNFFRSPDEEVRRIGCRALNMMYAELFAPHAERMTVPALIPMYTPQEGIEELEFAVTRLGMKSAVMGTGVRRPIAEVERLAPNVSSYATYIDVIGLGSDYDYDPLWQRCVDLKIPVSTHQGSQGWGTRTLPDNFVFNHIGHFSTGNEAFCKALVIGGVVQRFPTLTFAFLEGGVGWAIGLYNDLIEHWKTRNHKAMLDLLDPAKLDRAALVECFLKYGGERFKGSADRMTVLPKEDPADLDDWAALKIDDPRAFATFFERFYFGCEAEDRMTAVAFNSKLNKYGARLQPFLGSDIGHFDVPDITAAIAEAHELVEDGLLTESEFRDFTFANAAKLYTSMNPGFFKGTVVEDAVAV